MNVSRLGPLWLAVITLTGVITGCSSTTGLALSTPPNPPMSSGASVAPSPTVVPNPSELGDGTPTGGSTTPTDPEVTLSPATMSCSHFVTLTICRIQVWYGNVSDHPQQLDALTTSIVDAAGRTYTATTEEQNVDSLLVNPGLQRAVTWSVDLPTGTTPTQLIWYGPDNSALTVGLSEHRTDPAPAVDATTPSTGSDPTPVPSKATPKPGRSTRSNNPGGFTGSID